MKKVLVADDSLFMRRILTDLIGKRYQVIEAGSGAEALERFKAENPDLTFLDIVMPEGEGEGVRVLEELRKLNPGAKVVMITAVGQKAVNRRCQELGALDYIIKPFDQTQVQEVVREHLG